MIGKIRPSFVVKDDRLRSPSIRDLRLHTFFCFFSKLDIDLCQL